MSLLALARGGDREAWDRIVFLYSPLVDRWCRARHLSPDATSGIGQDVFLALLKNLGKFRKDEPGHSFRGWLWRLTENRIRDHYRWLRREPPAVGGAQDPFEQWPEEPTA